MTITPVLYCDAIEPALPFWVDQLGFTKVVEVPEGDKLGFVSRRVEGDLERFKEFIEGRGSETGAWRGEIHGGEVERGTGAPG